MQRSLDSKYSFKYTSKGDKNKKVDGRKRHQKDEDITEYGHMRIPLTRSDAPPSTVIIADTGDAYRYPEKEPERGHERKVS